MAQLDEVLSSLPPARLGLAAASWPADLLPLVGWSGPVRYPGRPQALSPARSAAPLATARGGPRGWAGARSPPRGPTMSLTCGSLGTSHLHSRCRAAARVSPVLLLIRA